MELILKVNFENTPSEDQKAAISEKIKLFLLEIDPKVSIDISTGEGSWWITATLSWVGAKFLDWFASKGFDIGMNALQKYLPTKDSEKAKDEDIYTEDLSEKPKDYAPLLQEMSKLMKFVDIKDGGEIKIILGAYDNSNNLGRVASLIKKDKDITFSIIQTDSKEDFDSLR